MRLAGDPRMALKPFRGMRTRMNWIRTIPHKTYFLGLTAVFGLEAAFLAVAPHDRKDWMLENALVLFFLLGMFWSYKRFPFSRISYTLIFLFLAVHEIGSHYTYSEVPYDAWFQALAGTTFNELVGWERNNFDRIVHFLYGLLLAYPIREIYFRLANADGFWGYFLPLDFTMSTSMLYELIEWAAAEFFGGELGAAYLGTQGDIWDAHKDMLLASLGALAAMLATMGLNMRLQKDFAREWSRSLDIKHREPLGEDEIARLWEERDRPS
jgi:putative membrane protein